MPDLDQELRTVASALVTNAPAPPPFPTNVMQPERRLPVRGLALTGVAAAVVLTAAAVVATEDGDRRVNAGSGAPAAPFRCNAEPPLRVTPVGATGGPFPTEAPGTRRTDAAQRVVHWTTADGVVELRWPATPQALYGDGTSPARLLEVAQFATPSQVEFDVAPDGGVSASRDLFAADVRVERASATPAPVAPCDTVAVLVAVGAGEWSTALRAAESSEDLGLPFEVLDAQPIIRERRAVDAPPDRVVACEGSGVPGGPPATRTGGPDADVRGNEPADVLREYLRRTRGATPSGYVEMSTPDGNITYAVDASGRGWTTIVSVERDGAGWFMTGWKASGC